MSELQQVRTGTPDRWIAGLRWLDRWSRASQAADLSETRIDPDGATALPVAELTPS